MLDWRYLESSKLPVLGNEFYDMADTMAGEALSRDLTVTKITKPDRESAIETEHKPAEDEVLQPVDMLIILRGFDTYRAATRELTRQNVQTVARLAGFSALGIYEKTPVGWLSIEKMHLFGHSFLMVQERMVTAFRNSKEPTESDRGAWLALAGIGRTIRGR